MTRTTVRFLLVACSLCPLTASAAVINLFTNLTSFHAAAGPGTQLHQDFEGFAQGANLSGVPVLPGITMSTNLAELSAFGATNRNAFATGDRSTGNAGYVLELGGSTTNIAFDILGFESIAGDPSTAIGRGSVVVIFEDGSGDNLDFAGNDTGAPLFVGIVSNMPIARVLWNEALEGNGGSEETALDNVRVVRPFQVALPPPAGLAILSLVILVFLRRRMPYRR